MVGEVVGHSEDKPVNRIRPTKSAAIAAAQELIDLNPGYEIIDLTDRPAEAPGQDRWPGASTMRGYWLPVAGHVPMSCSWTSGGRLTIRW